MLLGQDPGEIQKLSVNNAKLSILIYQISGEERKKEKEYITVAIIRNKNLTSSMSWSSLGLDKNAYCNLLLRHEPDAAFDSVEAKIPSLLISPSGQLRVLSQHRHYSRAWLRRSIAYFRVWWIKERDNKCNTCHLQSLTSLSTSHRCRSHRRKTRWRQFKIMPNAIAS